MSRKRIFTVHVNIDDMTALIAGLDGQEEKADWIDGYMVGVHGHPSRETWSPAKRGGYDFGALHFAEAEEFRATQAAKSALGVAAKQAKSNPDGTHGLPAGVPAEVPNPTIQQSNNPTNEQTKKPRSQSSAEAEEIYKAYPKHTERPEAIKEIAAALKIIAAAELLAAVQEYAKAIAGWPEEEKQFVPSCGRWMKKQRWLDDRSTWIKTAKQPKNGVKHDGFSKTDYFAGLEGLPTGD